MENVVVLLPEGKLFDQVFDDAIRAAIPNASRVPSVFSSESQLGSICNRIEAADLVIADISAANPNIMYQVGYAHGIGKRVLLLARYLESVPFDKARHEVIGYAGDLEFLRSEISAFIEGRKNPEPQSGEGSARAKFLSIFGDILKAHDCYDYGEVQLENPTTFILLNQDLELALVQDLARKARELGLRLKLM